MQRERTSDFSTMISEDIWHESYYGQKYNGDADLDRKHKIQV